MSIQYWSWKQIWGVRRRDRHRFQKKEKSFHSQELTFSFYTQLVPYCQTAGWEEYSGWLNGKHLHVCKWIYLFSFYVAFSRYTCKVISIIHKESTIITWKIHSSVWFGANSKMCIFPPSNISEIRVDITLVSLTEFERLLFLWGVCKKWCVL